MDTLVPYAIWAVIVLVGLGLLAMGLFGLRSLSYGKISPLSIVMILVPFVVLVGIGLVTSDWVVAAIWTLIIMLVIATGAIFITGLRSMFS